MPEMVDDRYSTIVEGANSLEETPPVLSVLVREGFVIGHLDQGKIPLWMCMRWSKENLVASLAEKERRRRFEVDKELPENAQGGSNYDEPGIDRGHLARNKDNLAWGEDNALSGDLMSNIVPQLPTLNRGPWYELEKVVSVAPEKRAAKNQTFWIIAGSVFDGGRIKKRIGNGIGVPDSYYKIIAWYDKAGEFKVMAFLFPFDATTKNPTKYLSSVDEVEVCTGLDFFPDLDPTVEVTAESVLPTVMWEE
jgi:endonuclease G